MPIRRQSLVLHLQAAYIDLAAVDRIAQAGNTTIQRLCAIFKQYPDRPCFGIPAKARPEWKLVTYRDVWERIQVCCLLLMHGMMSAARLLQLLACSFLPVRPWQPYFGDNRDYRRRLLHGVALSDVALTNAAKHVTEKI